MPEIGEEEIARAIYEGKPRNKPWDILPHEFKNQYRKPARAVLALLQPTLERARREEREREREQAAQTGYRMCAETRHVTLGDKVAAAIRKGSGE